MTDTIWVVVRDWGYEGYEPPEIAFAVEQDATDFAAFMNTKGSYGTYEVHPVRLKTFAAARLESDPS